MIWYRHTSHSPSGKDSAEGQLRSTQACRHPQGGQRSSWRWWWQLSPSLQAEGKIYTGGKRPHACSKEKRSCEKAQSLKIHGTFWGWLRFCWLRWRGQGWGIGGKGGHSPTFLVAALPVASSPSTAPPAFTFGSGATCSISCRPSVA